MGVTPYGASASVQGRSANGESCFYCHKPISADPAIFWFGGDCEVFLHPTCTVEWCLRLLRDVHEIECHEHVRVQLVADQPGVPRL